MWHARARSYDAILTHGFVMAEDGQKMSKSLGNITSPQEVAEKNGADILRLWVVVRLFGGFRIGGYVKITRYLPRSKLCASCWVIWLALMRPRVCRG